MQDRLVETTPLSHRLEKWHQRLAAHTVEKGGRQERGRLFSSACWPHMLGKPSGHGRRPVCWVRMLLHVPLWLVRLLQPQAHSVCWQASMTCFSQPPAKTFPLFLPFYFMSWLQSQAYVLFYEWRINALVKKKNQVQCLMFLFCLGSACYSATSMERGLFRYLRVLQGVTVGWKCEDSWAQEEDA